MGPIIPVVAGILGASAVVFTKVDMNHAAMRFFRDVARSKARKRLHGNKHALVPMLFGTEDPYIPKSLDDIEAEDALTLTVEELAFYDGFEEDTPLYLAINGRVYDVSAGGKFYAEGGKYHSFIGRDATRAFALGCTREDCISSETDDLTEDQWKEVNRWIELYETHDKYKFVGSLVENPVDIILERDYHDEIDVDEVWDEEAWQASWNGEDFNETLGEEASKEVKQQEERPEGQAIESGEEQATEDYFLEEQVMEERATGEIIMQVVIEQKDGNVSQLMC